MPFAMLRLAASMYFLVPGSSAESSKLPPDANASLAMLQHTASLRSLSEKRDHEVLCDGDADCEVLGHRKHGHGEQSMLEVDDKRSNNCVDVYVQSPKGSCDCPPGSAPILDVTICAQAATCYGLKMQIDNGIRINQPQGCFGQAHNVMFNPDAGQVLCNHKISVFCMMPTPEPTTPSPAPVEAQEEQESKCQQAYCDQNSFKWMAKCIWKRCKGCAMCAESGPTPQPTESRRSDFTFHVMPNEFLDPPCNTGLEKLASLGLTGSAEECEEKVLSVAIDEDDINYGIWRGDSTKECFTCKVHSNRLTVDYVDLPGAVGFVKQAMCTAFCASHWADWHTKCNWESRLCSGCMECAEAKCTGVGCPRCESYCQVSTMRWEKKCGYISKDCRGCNECSQVVALGLFVLRSVSNDLCLSVDALTSTVGLSTVCTDANSQWRLTLNLVSGHYTLLNEHTGKYLSIEGNATLAESVEEVDLSTEWNVQLAGVGRNRTFLLQATAAVKYLSTTADAHATITSSAEPKEKPLQWVFDQVADLTFNVLPDVFIDPGCSVGSVNATSLGVTVSSQECETRVTAASRVHEDLNVGVWRGDSSKECFACIAPHVSISAEYVDLKGAVSFAKRAMCDAVCGLNIEPWSAKCLWSSRMCAGCAECSQVACTDEGCPRCESHCMENALPWEKKCGWISKDCRGCNQCHEIVALGAFTLRVVGSAVGRLTCLIADELDGAVQLSDTCTSATSRWRLTLNMTSGLYTLLNVNTGRYLGIQADGTLSDASSSDGLSTFLSLQLDGKSDERAFKLQSATSLNYLGYTGILNLTVAPLDILADLAELWILDPVEDVKFTIMPDEFIDPPCSAELEYLMSLGTTESGRECELKIEAAASLDENINFGVWRGDITNECFSCVAQKSRFSVDYIDLTGAISFVKPAVCSALCNFHSSPWSAKCLWGSRLCSGCAECSQSPCMGLGCPRCESHCADKQVPWERKCGWVSKDCRGCNECSQLVALGVFTLRIVGRTVGSLLCLAYDAVRGVIGLSEDCTVASSWWRLTLNTTSGDHTLLNELTGKYLSIEGSTTVSEDYGDFASKWRVQLQGDKTSRQITLLSSASLDHLSVGVGGFDVTINPQRSPVKLPDTWILDQVEEAVFAVLPDEFIAPGCSLELEKLTLLGVTVSSQECQAKVVAATVADVNINYGFWRGDTTKECFTCVLQESRFANDYIDLSGAVSFLKKATCNAICGDHTAPWKTKCLWNSRLCSGCSECSDQPCIGVGCPRCESHCIDHVEPWAKKCGWISKDCRGCTECSHVVALGAFALRVVGKTLDSVLCLVVDVATGIIKTSETCTQPSALWRFTMDATSGLYMLLNAHTGKYLSVDANARLFEKSTDEGQDSKWIVELSGSRDARTFTLQPSADLKHLGVGADANLTLAPFEDLADLSDAWFLDQVADAVFTVLPDEFIAPGCSSELEKLTLLGVTVSSQACQAKVEAATLADASVNYGFWRGDTTNECFTCVLQDSRFTNDYIDLSGVVSFVKKTVCSAVCDAHIAPWSTKCLWDSKICSGCSDCADMPCSGDECPRCESHCMEPMEPWEKKCGWISKECRGCNECHHVVALGVFTLRTVQKSLGRVVCLVVDVDTGIISTSDCTKPTALWRLTMDAASGLYTILNANTGKYLNVDADAGLSSEELTADVLISKWLVRLSGETNGRTFTLQPSVDMKYLGIDAKANLTFGDVEALSDLTGTWMLDRVEDALFTVLPNVFIAPGCNLDVEKLTFLGVTVSSQECAAKISAASIADASVNYGVWRGDTTKECFTCVLQESRFAKDYIDLGGAVSFLKKATCNAICGAHTAPWQTKCLWDSRLCSGCSECSEMQCTGADCPRCESHCMDNVEPWAAKCGWISKDCRGCNECSPIVALGAFALRVVGKTSAHVLCLVVDVVSGLLMTSETCTEPSAVWRLTMDVKSGLFTFLNSHTGKFLSVDANTSLFEDGTGNGPASKWIVQLTADRSDLTFTLQPSIGLKHLTVGANANVALASQDAITGLTDVWFLDTVADAAFSVLPDEFIAPGCSPEVEHLTLLGVTVSSQACQAKVEAASVADASVNYGFWRGDATKECFACVLPDSRVVNDYIELGGVVSFVKKTVCSAVCGANIVPWGTKCLWDSKICAGCSECSDLPCSGEDCPRCESHCMDNTDTWEHKCGWISKDCRGCNECHQIVALGAFTLRTAGTTLANVVCLVDDVLSGIIKTSDCTEPTAVWRLTMDVTSGLYTFLNAHTGKYLSVDADASLSEEGTADGPGSKWIVHLSGDTDGRTFTLQPSVNLKHLSIDAGAIATLGDLEALDDLTDTWILDRVEEAVFSVLPNEFIAPGCNLDLEKLTLLGVTVSSQECQAKVIAASVADANINYGVWRGDTTNECFTCVLQESRFARDYVDLSGAASFLKKATCGAICGTHTAPWLTKCLWDSRLCSGCSECSETQCTGADCPRCESHCMHEADPWEKKCGWISKDCRGCNECGHVVALGAFVLRVVRDASIDVLCLVADAVNGLVTTSKTCSDPAALWRLTMDAKSGLYTLLNTHTGKHLSVDADLNLLEDGSGDSPLSKWTLQLSSDRADFTFTLQPSTDLKHLSVGADAQLTIAPSDALTGLTDVWFLDQVVDAAFTVIPDEFIAPGCSPELEELTLLGVTVSSQACQAKVEAATLADANVNYGFWRGDTTNECFTCVLPDIRFTKDYIDLNGVVSFVKKTVCSAVCSSHTAPWNTKCLWDSKICSGCSNCKDVPCSGEDCPRCESHCMENTQTWEHKCGWINKDCRGCNECHQVVALGAFTLRTVGKTLGKVVCLIDDVVTEVIRTSDCTEPTAVWRLTMDVTSGLYTLLNVHTGKFLSVDADANLSQEFSPVGPDAKWIVQLNGDTSGRTFTLQPSVNLQYLSIDAHANVTLSAVEAIDELTDAWILDRVEDAVFSVLPNEFIAPGCDLELEKLTLLGVTVSSQDCEAKIIAASLANANVNYGVWRGDTTRECFTCVLQESRFANDYIDLSGAVSFLKKATCNAVCGAHTAPWQTKCLWDSRLCSGCSECSETQCSGAACPRCESHCMDNVEPWEKKCGWIGKDCRGCNECDTVVALGAFVLRVVGKTSAKVLCLVADAVTGIIKTSEICADPTAVWRLAMDVKSGLHTLLNSHSGKYLSVDASFKLFEDITGKGPVSKWIVQLTRDRADLTFTLQTPTDLKHLSVGADANVIVSSVDAFSGLSDVWFLDQVIDAAFTVLPDEFIAPGCSPELEKLTLLGIAISSEECQAMVEAATLADAVVNYGYWRGDTTKECFTCVLQGSRFTDDYIDLNGAVSFVKKAVCSAVCGAHTVPWSTKCLWDSQLCSGCSECSKLPCTGDDCLRCEDHCMERAEPWEKKCGWISKDCRGCNECHHIVALGAFTLRAVGKTAANVYCLVADIASGLVKMSDVCTDPTAVWRLVTDVNTGLYTMLNAHTGKYLSLDAEANLVEDDAADGPTSKWLVQLSADGNNRTFTLQPSVNLRYLSIDAEANLKFDAVQALDDLTDNWLLDKVEELVDETLFSVLPDELVDAPCSLELGNLLSLGTTSSSQECQRKVSEVSVADADINYGVWRGDSSMECVTCKLEGPRLAVDYSDLSGAVSFVKQSMCHTLCSTYTFPWTTKCLWSSRVCSGCSECAEVGCTGADCPRCESHCMDNKEPWERKCGWISRDCRGCNQCNQLVALGVFTLRTAGSLLCLAVDEVSDLLRLSDTCTDNAAHWRLTLNMVSGQYSLLNVDIGKYLSITGDGLLSFTETADASNAWHVKLDAAGSDRTFTLQAAVSSKYLNAPIDANVSLASLRVPTGGKWLVEQWQEPLFTVLPDEYIDPPIMVGAERLTNLGRVASSYDCAVKVHAAAAMDKNVNLGVWRGDSTQECVTAKVHSHRTAVDYTDLKGAVTFAKQAICSRLCSSHTSPWASKCEWESRLCAGCSECSSVECSGVDCPRCHSGCMEVAEPWESKCGWINKNCRGCNECSQVVALGVFVLRSVGNLLCLVADTVHEAIGLSDACMDRAAQWRMTLNTTSGLYTLLNVESGRYLSIGVNGTLLQANTGAGTIADWYVKLSSLRSLRAFTLQARNTLKYISFEASVNLTLSSLGAPTDLPKLWLFEQYEEAAMREEAKPVAQPAAPGVPASAPTESPTSPKQVDFCTSTLVHNNLAGLGPDSGDKWMLFKNVTADNTVDLYVTNLTLYNPWNVEQNGLHGDNNCIMALSLKCGEEVTVRFSFVSATTSLPALLDRFNFVALDIDEGKNSRCRESVEVTGYASYNLPADSTLSQHLNVGDFEFKSTVSGTGSDNPTNAASLTKTQKEHSVKFLFTNVQSFDITFKTNNDQPADATDPNIVGYAGRKILFAGSTSLDFPL